MTSGASLETCHLTIFERTVAGSDVASLDQSDIEKITAAAALEGIAIVVGRMSPALLRKLQSGRWPIMADVSFTVDLIRHAMASETVTQIKFVAETVAASGAVVKYANDLRRALSRNRPRGRKIKCDFDEDGEG